jgi:CRP-like cAMP-binding protein
LADHPDLARWLTRRLAPHFTLDQDDLAEIARLPATIRRHESGQYLLREGDRPKSCAFLLSGYVFRHKIVGDGGRQIVAISVPGDFVDLQNVRLATADHNIQALTHVDVAHMSVEDLAGIAARRPTIAAAFWRETLVESSAMREWIANIGRRDARTRAAHLLCELALRCEASGLGPRETFQLPMTQEQLGDALGLTSVHVNRTLKTLEDEGLLSRTKRLVAVKDWEGLRRAGDFASAYLHLDDKPD